MADPARARQPLGIFGGTFDPVHFGHLRLAEEAADELALAGIRWIPAGQPALRAAPQTTARQRLAMVQLATAGNPCFAVDAAEVAAARPSYTVETLERLRSTDSCGAQRPLVLLLGADAFAGLPGWHRWQSLFDLAHLGIAHRPGHPLDLARLAPALAEQCRARRRDSRTALAESPAGCIVTFAMTQLAISASRIRALLTSGSSVRYLLPDEVIAYIRHHHLYPEC
ncbi:MAG: nicotinate-nucleotide adenylyltransferase [Candidatus Accumulibacter sp.]|uniref:nicotinate-nucleotide adenylyltransferase n=1 Tax=Accumulibacter sp. TaxID=2053492 RepID=UPI001A414B1F|nr:nicotinate-nucleotide adenylyltransferase [Accumulibacter sp.]MBL8394328.1 nicotinate-nucleotide adenylyltransferase [Accumulibacter sp.]